jgi:hypothetical protein
MSNWTRKWPFLIGGSILAPITMGIAFVSAGFGHGNYVLARIFLPYACLGIASGNYPGHDVLILLLAIAQYPVYGYLLDRVLRPVLFVSSVLVLHAALATWLLFGNRITFV